MLSGGVVRMSLHEGVSSIMVYVESATVPSMWQCILLFWPVQAPSSIVAAINAVRFIVFFIFYDFSVANL
jgi:hypothetical protein